MLRFGVWEYCYGALVYLYQHLQNNIFDWAVDIVLPYYWFKSILHLFLTNGNFCFNHIEVFNWEMGT
jgi:hypothetical protein